jgi:Phage derived protein Gp49-like (DUF891)
MERWTFFDFLSERGENEIHRWLNSGMPKAAKAKINARIAALQGFPIFPEQYVSAFAGWPGLLELRIVSGGVQYRPLGYYGPGRGQFSILVGGVEKGKLPTRLLEVANERRTIVNNDPSRVCRHDFS